MERIVRSEGKKNIDSLLDEYNDSKTMYEQTKDEKYRQKMKLYLGIMKAATTPLTIKIGPEIPFNQTYKL